MGFGYKACPKCFRRRRVSSFHKDARRKTGRSSTCKFCKRATRIVRYAKEIDTIKMMDIALKMMVLWHYSKGAMKCKTCDEDRIECLSIDHVNGDGMKHRRQLNCMRGGIPFYRKLVKLGLPNDPPLDVLCISCNSRKGGEFGFRIRHSPAHQAEATEDRRGQDEADQGTR